MNKQKKFFKGRTIAVDIFDFQIRALTRNKGIYFDEDIRNLYQSMPKGMRNEKLKGILDSNKYKYDFDLLMYLFKYIVKQSKPGMFKSKMIIAIPCNIVYSDHGELWKRAITEAATRSNIKEIYLMEDLMCAAVGLGIPGIYDEHGEDQKAMFIHCRNSFTCAGVVFAGGILSVQTIDIGANEINIENIKQLVVKVKENLPNELPESFYSGRLKKDVLENFQRRWKTEMDKTIYISVPLSKKEYFPKSIGEHELQFTPNNELCVMEGLKKAIERFS